MKLSPPKVIVWWISVILGVLGIILHLGLIKIAFLDPYVFWIEVLALAILVVATLIKNM